MRSSWIASALASSLCLGAGCAGMTGDSRADQAKLGRLSMEQKQQVFTAEHNVEVAQANVKEAERSLDQARQFRDISKSELKVAEAHADAARKTMNLGRETPGTQMERSARQQLDLADRAYAAGRSKVDYAERVVALREAELDRARKQYGAAQADVRLSEYKALQRAGEKFDPKQLAAATKALDDANAQVAESERKIAVLRDETQATRTSWDQARQRFNVAARDIPAAPPVQAPQAPAQIQPEPMPQMPAPGETRPEP